MAVLARNVDSGKHAVQTRRISVETLVRHIYFLNLASRAQDVAILKDTDGNSVLDDPSYLELAINPATGKNVVFPCLFVVAGRRMIYSASSNLNNAIERPLSPI